MATHLPPRSATLSRDAVLAQYGGRTTNRTVHEERMAERIALLEAEVFEARNYGHDLAHLRERAESAEQRYGELGTIVATAKDRIRQALGLEVDVAVTLDETVAALIDAYRQERARANKWMAQPIQADPRKDGGGAAQ